MKTLKKFLEKNQACDDGSDFAKDLTLEQFLNTCDQGDWILWLFAKINPDSLRELTLAKAHCANTVRHLMKDERSIKAVDVAIAFGEGKATREELDDAAYAADAAASAADAASNAAYATRAAAVAAYAARAAAVAAYAARAANAAALAAYAAGAAAYAAEELIAPAYANVANAAYFANVARVENRKQTADICRKYLPLEIWNNN